MIRTILSVLCLALCASAQSSPLKTIGKYTCHKRPYNPNGQAGTRVTGVGPVAVQNVSGKKIVAVVIKIEASCGDIGTFMTGRDGQPLYVHDMAFKSEAFPAGGIIDLPVDTDEGRSGTVSYHTGTLNVESLFVQFEDGSTWGDSGYKQKFSEDRAQAVRWLMNLRGTIDDKEFTDALNSQLPEESDVSAIQMHLQMTLAQSGINTVRAMIVDRLRTYNERMANGQF